MRKYYIVGNRAFNTRGEAESYCNDSDFDPETMITEAAETGNDNKYYEIITDQGNGIQYRTPSSAKKLRDPMRARELENLKAGEYGARFIRMSEISRDEYDALMREYGWID